MKQASPHAADRRCTARSKRSRERCQNWAMVGHHVCRMHGGKSLKGIAHPNFVHGRRSKYQLPPDLAARVEALLDDADLIDQIERLAMLTGLEQQLTSELTGDDERDRGTWIRLFEVQQQIAKLTELELRRRYADGIPRSIVFSALRSVLEANRLAILEFEGGMSIADKRRLIGSIADGYYRLTGERFLTDAERGAE